MTFHIHDNFARLKHGLLDIHAAFHHIVTITGMIGVICRNYDGRLLALGIFICEGSAFAYHSRRILGNIGMRDTKIYSWLENDLFFVYTLFRGIGGPWTIYLTLSTSEAHVFELIIAILMVAQSYVTFPMFYKVLKRRFEDMNMLREHHIEKYWFVVNPEIE